MHCDFFLDNILLHKTDGSLSALIDWEDTAAGYTILYLKS